MHVCLWNIILSQYERVVWIAEVWCGEVNGLLTPSIVYVFATVMSMAPATLPLYVCWENYIRKSFKSFLWCWAAASEKLFWLLKVNMLHIRGQICISLYFI